MHRMDAAQHNMQRAMQNEYEYLYHGITFGWPEVYAEACITKKPTCMIPS